MSDRPGHGAPRWVGGRVVRTRIHPINSTIDIIQSSTLDNFGRKCANFGQLDYFY